MGGQGHGQIEWADKYLNSYNTILKVPNYYLGLTGDKNIVCDNLPINKRYSHLLQKFIDSHLELKVKYGYYNFLPEKLIVISCIHPQEWCTGCKSHINICSELLKRISRIIESSWDNKTNTPIYTEHT
jgi:hypothetical protein